MWTHEDRVTCRRCPLDCVGTRRRHPHRWMRMLERLRQNFDIVEREVFSAVAKPLVAPCCQDDFNRLTKTQLAFALGHGESSKLARIEAASCTPIHSTAGQDIEQCDLLGQADRM